MCVCVSAAEGFSKAGNGCGCGVQALNIEGMFGPVCVCVCGSGVSAPDSKAENGYGCGVEALNPEGMRERGEREREERKREREREEREN